MSFLIYIDRVNLSASAKLIQDDLGLNNTELGLIFSAFAYSYCIFQILGGWIVDKLGARKVIIVCGMTWVISTLLTGLAGGFVGLFLSRLLLGVGEGATLPSQARAISFWFRPDERGFVQGLTHSFSRLGNAVTPPIIFFLVSLHSWRFAFFALAVLTALWTVVWYFKFTDNPRDAKNITAKELEGLPPFVDNSKSQSDVKTPWKKILKRVWPTMAVYFCYGWTGWLFFTWLPTYLMQGRHLDLKGSAIFTMGVFLSGVVGNTVGGVISDKILKKTGNVVAARRNVIIFSFATALLLLGVVVTSSSLAVTTVAISLAFFCLELTIGPIWAVPMDVAPKHVGVASGLMNAGSAVAGIISPIIFGIIIDQTGNWNLPFYGSILLLIIGIFLTFFLRPDIKMED
ncbi:MFS transporter [Bartonella sp. LJL80]